MFPEVKNNSLILSQELGLNGFWKKLAQKLAGIALGMVREVPVVGNFIADEITSRISKWMSDNGQSTDMNRGVVEYVPTPAEELIIVDWNANKFAPFYKILVSDLTIGLGQLSVQAQISAINIAFAKMMVIRDWHINNNTVGLSASAVAWRTEYIVALFQPLFDKIDEIISPYQYDETAMWLPDVKSIMSQELPSINYLPLISGTPYGLIVHQYFIRGYAPNTPMLPGYDGSTAPPLPPVTPPVTPPVVFPPTQTSPPVITPVVTPTPTKPVTPVVPKPVATPVAQPQNFLQKNKAVIGIGALVLAALWPSDKKKKKD